MRFRLHGGVFTVGLGLLGAGAVIVWPDQVLIGWSLMLAALAVFLWGVKFDGEHWWARSQIRMTWPFILIVVSLVGLIVGGTMAYRSGLPPTKVAESEAPGVLAPAVPRIVVECSQIGDFVDINGPHSALLLFPNPEKNGGATAMSSTSGGGAKAGELGISYKCKITNFGPAALINLRIPLRLSFRKVKIEHQEGGGTTMQTGELTLARDGLLPVPILGVGPLESFEFYIQNNSPLSVGIEFPDKAEAQRADRLNRESVAISTTMNYPMTAFPTVEKAS